MWPQFLSIHHLDIWLCLRQSFTTYPGHLQPCLSILFLLCRHWTSPRSEILVSPQDFSKHVSSPGRAFSFLNSPAQTWGLKRPYSPTSGFFQSPPSRSFQSVSCLSPRLSLASGCCGQYFCLYILLANEKPFQPWTCSESGTQRQAFMVVLQEPAR